MGTICTDCQDQCVMPTGAIHRQNLLSRLKALGWQVIVWIIGREEKRLSRIALSELTDAQLVDIGVTPAEARREAARPFWN